ncbi:guanylate kinase [Anaerolineaceae bacterium oral taxon 439]|nr:guanylate kinase [Anaerolineaceae bacterium oral taxon 439]
MTERIPYFKVIPPDPLILILSGLSGAGKDTVIETLKRDPGFRFHFVVTMNTRAPREHEVDGVDYHFITREHFAAMIERDELVEYAKVYDDYKGISRAEIDQAFSTGHDLLLRIDHQGARKVKEQYPQAISIFIIPPDSETWSRRLIGRGTDSASDLQTRLSTANQELDHISDFDYLVINDSLEQTKKSILTIIEAERCRTIRNHIRRTPIDRETA